MGWESLYEYVKQNWKPKVYQLKEKEAKAFVLQIIKKNKLDSAQLVFNHLAEGIKTLKSNAEHMSERRFPEAKGLEQESLRELKKFELTHEKFKAFVASVQHQQAAVPAGAKFQFA